MTSQKKEAGFSLNTSQRQFELMEVNDPLLTTNYSEFEP